LRAYFDGEASLHVAEMAMAQRRTLNRILRALPPDVRDQVVRQSGKIEFKSGHVIYAAGEPVEHIYFINTGLVSLVKSMRDGQCVEVGAVGAEGLIGVFASFGFDHALVDYIVQVPVAALRVSRRRLESEILRQDALQKLVAAYLFLLTNQLAQVSACNRLHLLEQRFCHWLLVAHDNCPSDNFRFTHESLALLLGVQRPSVSTAANALRKRGLIRYSHGRVTILDRGGIEETACECYRTLRRQIDDVLGPSDFTES
jgi:CRP-like cAMP-binding protein